MLPPERRARPRLSETIGEDGPQAQARPLSMSRGGRWSPACLPLCTALRLRQSRPCDESETRAIRGACGACDGCRGGAGIRYPVGAPAVGGQGPMNELLLDYLPLVIFIAVALAIAVVLLLTPFVIAYKQPDPEKLSAYECGFNAFDDARMTFDVRFYLVAILFIIFDLEVSFLFPWAVAFGDIGVVGFWSMVVFLGVLTVGFIYEWRKGALEWD